MSVISPATPAAAVPAAAPPYRDARQPVSARVEDLLARMTLEEKIGQMCQYVGFQHLQESEPLAGHIPANDDGTGAYPDLTYADLWTLVRQGRIGSFLHVVSSEEANRVQAAARETRLGIPLLIAVDAIHGHGLGAGATIYPAPLTMAAAFDPPMVEAISRQVAAELRANGIHWTFAPNIDVARDPRWGRTGETFGEDPLLVSRLGAAAVRGFASGGIDGRRGVIACLKHLIAGSEPANGLNSAPMDVSERTLRAVHWPPYEAGLAAGAGSVMLAHHDLNGVPCHANAVLVEDELRGRLGFDGFVVSDWTDVSRLATLHHVAAGFVDAVELAVAAGLDMHMHGPGFFEAVLELVRAGRLTEARIDRSVRRLLRAKFQLGLFEQADVPPAAAAAVVGRPEHQALALEAARKGLVLVKNDRALLPLDVAQRPRVLVTGPLADSPAILGDWVAKQPPERVVTVLEGLRRIGDGVQIDFADVGSSPLALTAEAIAKAAAAAKQADVIVAVVGESAYRPDPQRTSGENRDRADLDLPGEQLALLQALQASGRPVVAVVVQSRPLGSPWMAEHVPAILVAGEPGAWGGQAVAEALFGRINPSGRLPITTARSAGHLPSYYNHFPAQYWRDYAVGSTPPLYPFGHGLSYTTFTYSRLVVPPRVAPGEAVSVAVELTNTGARAGEEIVLVFVNDRISSVVTPVRELKAFARVALAAGETATVRLTIPGQDLALVDPRLRRRVEPGEFEVFVGSERAVFTVEAD